MKSANLTVGLCYNLRSNYPRLPDEPEDASADCEEEATVEAVEAALAGVSREVVRFPYGPNLLDDFRKRPVDIVFNIAEGWRGRNRESHVPCLLEMLGIPYTGSDALTLGITMDKALCKRLAVAVGIPTAPFLEIRRLEQLNGLSLVEGCEGEACLAPTFPLPAFVKPNWEGSSKGVRYSSVVEDEGSLKERVAWCLEAYKQPVLVEKLLPGREFTVGILGNEDPKAFPVGEIHFFQATKEEALAAGEGARFKPGRELEAPAKIPSHFARQLQQVALTIYRALRCRDVGRVDFRCDEQGNPCFLEINALPGLNPEYSMLPLVAKGGGVGYEQLVRGILCSALERLGMGEGGSRDDGERPVRFR